MTQVKLHSRKKSLRKKKPLLNLLRSDSQEQENQKTFQILDLLSCFQHHLGTRASEDLDGGHCQLTALASREDSQSIKLQRKTVMVLGVSLPRAVEAAVCQLNSCPQVHGLPRCDTETAKVGQAHRSLSFPPH